MTTDLFQIETALSPRLAWLKRYALVTRQNEGVAPGDECEFTGDRIYPWICATTHVKSVFASKEAGWGDTEDDAITNWAIKNDARLWNEEGL